MIAKTVPLLTESIPAQSQILQSRAQVEKNTSGGTARSVALLSKCYPNLSKTQVSKAHQKIKSEASQRSGTHLLRRFGLDLLCEFDLLCDILRLDLLCESDLGLV